ncbi:unnamed protein product [Ixodes pacificus]
MCLSFVLPSTNTHSFRESQACTSNRVIAFQELFFSVRCVINARLLNMKDLPSRCITCCFFVFVADIRASGIPPNAICYIWNDSTQSNGDIGRVGNVFTDILSCILFLFRWAAAVRGRVVPRWPRSLEADSRGTIRLEPPLAHR